FDYPLELEEVYFYLISNTKYSKEDIQKGMSDLLEMGKIKEKNNVYFLLNRDNIIDTRKERYSESLNKIRRAMKAIKFLKYLPFVRAVFLCNVLGYFNAKKQDDIDFFIITSTNRIWTARWFATGFFKILNLRPTQETVQDKFCFSFYVSENGMNLENIKLENDIYLTQWFSGLLPIYDSDNYLENFLQSNSWVEKELLNYKDIYVSERLKFKFKKNNVFIQKILEKIFGFNFFEKIFKKIQLTIMPKILKEQMNKGPGVIVSDNILKMHPYDKREEFSKKFDFKIKEIIYG
ncbi:MAG: hypothetical protein ABIA91_00465, partial [Patescibacteria group bacterium]